MNGVNVDKCLQIYCQCADTLTDEQVERAINLAEIEGDTRVEIMRMHVACCGRGRNILRHIYQVQKVLTTEITWIWDTNQCFP